MDPSEEILLRQLGITVNKEHFFTVCSSCEVFLESPCNHLENKHKDLLLAVQASWGLTSRQEVRTELERILMAVGVPKLKQRESLPSTYVNIEEAPKFKPTIPGISMMNGLVCNVDSCHFACVGSDVFRKHKATHKGLEVHPMVASVQRLSSNFKIYAVNAETRVEQLDGVSGNIKALLDLTDKVYMNQVTESVETNPIWVEVCFYYLNDGYKICATSIKL
jgi:hypothetical protein